MGWKDEYGDIDPYENDSKPAPSEWDDDLKEDEHGDYNPYAGSQTPTKGRCSAVLKYTQERYGETRYCTALPQSCFGGDSEFCKKHVAQEALVKQQYDSFKTGAFVESYSNLLDKIGPGKKIVAAELFESLLHESKYDFEPDIVDYKIDTSDAGFVDEDEVTIELPVPTTKKVQGQSLWFAALSFVKIQNINEQLFKDSIESGFGIGERETTVAVREDGSEVKDLDEHHLNLPLSRIEKDYKDHLKLGGVDMSSSEDGSVVTVDNREWTMEVLPDDDEDDDEEPQALDGEAIPIEERYD